MVKLTSPYREGEGIWLKGNLHTHTTESDGTRSVPDVLVDYERRNYDFLAISDHDTFTDPEQFEDRTSMILVPAVEVSANGPDLHHLNAFEAIQPDEDRQVAINEIVEKDGIAILNHPNWGTTFSHWEQDDVLNLEGYAGLEIYNGVIEGLPGAALATDRWDQALSRGKQIWGFANDDAHRGSDVSKAWNMVHATGPTPEGVLEAIAAGDFYASTGVDIEDITVNGNMLSIQTANAEYIEFVSDHGIIQQRCEGQNASFRIPEKLVLGSSHSYVRVQCVGSGRAMAWTQPFYFAE